jgi:hypothetical protein
MEAIGKWVNSHLCLRSEDDKANIIIDGEYVRKSSLPPSAIRRAIIPLLDDIERLADLQAPGRPRSWDWRETSWELLISVVLTSLEDPAQTPELRGASWRLSVDEQMRALAYSLWRDRHRGQTWQEELPLSMDLVTMEAQRFQRPHPLPMTLSILDRLVRANDPDD